MILIKSYNSTRKVILINRPLFIKNKLEIVFINDNLKIAVFIIFKRNRAENAIEKN